MLRTILVLIALVAPVAAAPDAKQLAKDRVAAADKVYTATLAQLSAGRAGVESAYVWSVRWLDAELATNRPAKQALADHLARMAALETQLEKAVQTGTVSSTDHQAAIYFHLEAQWWVARGKR